MGTSEITDIGPGRCPRRRSLRVAGTWPWYPGRCLVVRRRYLIAVPVPFPAAPLIVRRRYLTVVPRPLPRCAPQELDCGAQTDSRGAAQVIGRCARATARGVARCASQVFDRGAQAVACGAARCAPQVLARVAQAAARGAARCARRNFIVVPRPLPAAPRCCRSRRRETRKTYREHNKYYRHYLNRGKVTLVAMYLRRARVVDRSFAAAPTHVCCAACTCGKKPWRVPPAALPGADVW
jgi:hypothetical protein